MSFNTERNMLTELFPEKDKNNLLPLRDAEVYYYPDFFNAEKAQCIFQFLQKGIHWEQDEIKIFGKTFPQPRLTALFGNNEKPYSYSGIKMTPTPFPSELLKIKTKLEERTNLHFTTCLANYYRNGKDSMGWHADNEKELGKNPIIASISFGAERMFYFKHRKYPEQRFKIKLLNGSLLLMKGKTQHHWLHQIPKSSKEIGPRINLTFRRIGIG